MTRTREQNVDAGRIAKAAGDAFENFIDEHHSKARSLRLLAHVEHNQAKAKVLPGGGLTYVGKGPSDYTGMLADGGRVYAAEAKSVAGVRLMRSAIKKKQAEHLDAVARAGGLALLLVEFRREDVEWMKLPVTRYAVPWASVPWKKVKTAESVSEVDILPFLIEGDCFLSWHCKPGPPGSVKPAPGRVYPRG